MVIFIGFQSDVPSKDREVSHDQLRQWCEDNKISMYIETSAKSDNNVMEAFSMAVQRYFNLLQTLLMPAVSSSHILKFKYLNTILVISAFFIVIF